MIGITIAIPTFNRADSLALTLRSLRNIEIPKGAVCELLVIDNNSPDQTQKTVSAAAGYLSMPVRSLIEHHQGLCFARNRALQAAAGEHVVFLDDDIEVGPHWLVGYADAIHALQADCVVGPVRAVFPTNLPPYATKYVLRMIGSMYSQKGNERLVMAPEVAHEIPGCNFGVRRDVGLRMGGFSNDLDRIGTGLLAGGDFEFGIRLVKAGKRVVYEPRCRIDHLIPTAKLEQAYLRRRARGAGLTSAKLRSMHGPPRSVKNCVKDVKLAAGLWARWQKHRLFGTAPDAFSWELRTRAHVTDLVSHFFTTSSIS